MSTTTPPQTPAGEAIAATAIKQEAGSDNMTMNDAAGTNKFTPLNRETESNIASDSGEEPAPHPTPKASPKKRGANAVKDEADGSPTKKRAPAKPKVAKEAKAPKEKVVKEKAPKSSKAAAAATKGDKRPIPSSFEEADEADRLLVQMKNDGASWKDIKDMWVSKTGQVPGNSTLSGRFTRIKDNLAHLEPGEAEILREAIKSVEARLSVEKWNMVAKEMESHGCKKYTNSFLQKQLKIIDDQVAKGTYKAEKMAGGKAKEVDAEEDAEMKDEDEEGIKGEEDEDAIKAEDDEED